MYHTSKGHTVGLNTEEQKAGFDFLGFNIRQYKAGKNTGKGGYGFKTLIKPSKKALKTHLEVIKTTIYNLRGATQEAVIKKLRPIINGWSNYYCTSVARKTYEKAAHETHRKLWRWAIFRHPHKGRQWIKRKYFRQHGGFAWRFMTHKGIFLTIHSDHSIKRHIKVQGRKSPYDGDWPYWTARMGRNPLLSPRVAKLLKRQKGKCAHCKWCFTTENILEVHHVDNDHKNNKDDNLILIHGHCHDDIHGKGMNVKH